MYSHPPSPKDSFFSSFLSWLSPQNIPREEIEKKTKKFKIQVSRLLENAFLMLFLTAEA